MTGVVPASRSLAGVAAMFCSFIALAAQPSPHAIEAPSWFKETFLDVRDDLRDAAHEGKRIMLYFGQDGCPYCRRLMQVNFAQKDIVDRTRKSIYPIALNIWGDREVTWLDGNVLSEKALAAALQVQFTPTLLFLNESGDIVVRINGYYPPHRFRAALEFVANKLESKHSFADYMRIAAKEPAGGKLNSAPFFMRAPLDLTRGPAAKSLAVLIEQAHCTACDEMHTGPLKAARTRRLLERFDVARIDLFGVEPIVTADGRRTTESAWAQTLAINYTPSVVLFDIAGKEVLRIEGYVRTLHLQTALDYVATGAYRTQPSFQRFLQTRVEQLRAKGETVTIW